MCLKFVMNSRGGNFIVATPKTSNVYAAKVVLDTSKNALRQGKSENTILIPNPLPGGSSRRRLPSDCLALLENRGNFERSAVPARVMFFQNGKWNDFPVIAMADFRRAFEDRKLCALVETDGARYLVDFIRMLQFDLQAGMERSVAWIDVNGKCFFPKTFVGEGSRTGFDCSAIKLEIEINVDKSEGSEAVDSEAQSKNRALEGGEDRILRPGLSPANNEDAKCKVEPEDRRSEDGSGTAGQKAGSSEKENHHVSIGDRNEKEADNAATATRMREGSSGKPNDCTNCKLDTLDGSTKRGVKGTPVKEESDKVGLSSSGEHKEVIARIPDLNQKETDSDENEILVSKVGNLIGDDTRENPNGKINCARFEEFVVVSRLKDVGPDNGNSSGAHGRDVACKKSIGTSLKRGLEAFVGQSTQKHNDEMPNSSKRAYLSCSPQPDTLHEKPGFASMGIVLAKLSDNHKAYISVRNLFVGGMSRIDPSTQVKAIYWCSHASPMGSARLEAFQKTLQMTKATRGDANIKLAWHGSSPKIIESIVVHGFSKVGNWSGATPYGFGVYLTPENQPYASASSSEPDVDNEFHVVLCRVIMGNMEQVALGSCQFHPSEEGFDNAVDNMEEPKWYVVWSTYMNTHILPEYVVSFTVSGELQEMWKKNLVRDSLTIPKAHGSPSEIPKSLLGSSVGSTGGKSLFLGLPPSMSYNTLFAAMRGQVPDHMVESMEKAYNDYKAGKYSVIALARTLRSIAGDEPIISALSRIRSQP